ncbi:MAG: hypothetical protein ABIQ15_14725 [Nocardioides sp.]
MPSPINPPSVCRFRTRSSIAQPDQRGLHDEHARRGSGFEKTCFDVDRRK